MPMPRAGALAALAATMTVGCGVAATTASTARATPPRGGTIEFYTSGTLATPIRAYVITGAFADSGATSPKNLFHNELSRLQQRIEQARTSRPVWSSG
jgi:hypothetical protein